MASAQMRSSRGLRAFRVTTSTSRPRSSSRSWTKATRSRREAPGPKPTRRSRSLSGRPSPLATGGQGSPRGGGATPPWSARHRSRSEGMARRVPWRRIQPGYGFQTDSPSPRLARRACCSARRHSRGVRSAPSAASRRTGAARDIRDAGHTRRASIARRFRRRFSQGFSLRRIPESAVELPPM